MAVGQSYVVTDVYLYDQEWKQGSFSVSAGSPGSWSVLFTDALTRNNQWFGQKVTATARYLRLTRHATGSFVNEVVVYGYLSDLDWVTAVNGFQSIGVDKANGGVGDLTLGGVRYAKGLGVHANSEITYAIGGGYKRFRAKVGASDGEWGFSARFEVWGDGVKRFDSGPMYGTTGPTTQIADIDIDVTGVNSLVIKLVSLDAGISGDHGVWAGARLLP